MAFIAKFHGTCSSCCEAIRPGELINKDDGEVATYSHEECPDPFPEETDDELAVPEGHILCSNCWLFHPPGRCDR